MLYYRDKSGKEIPVDMQFFDLQKLQNSFVVVRVGDKEFQPTNDDLSNITKVFNDYFAAKNLNVSGLFTHDKIDVQIMDKEQFVDKVVIVKVGDPDSWRPTEAYLTSARRDILDAFGDIGVKDVIVLDILSDIEVQS